MSSDISHTSITADPQVHDPFRERTAWSQGRRIRVGDVELWCHDTGGDGEVILLLGGFTAGHFVFDFVRRHLPGYRLVTWEPRGLGESDRPDPVAHPYSTDIWAADLMGLLQALDIDRAHVWADGFGGYIALRLAAEHPEVVTSLITSTEVWAGFEDRSKNWNIYSAIVNNLGTTGRGARLLAKWMDVETLPWFVSWESRNVEDVLHLETVDATVGYGLLRADVRADLPRVKSPTMVMLGGVSGGSVSDDPALEEMRANIEDLRVHVVDQAHVSYSVVTHPQECASVARAFFESHAMAKPAR